MKYLLVFVLLLVCVYVSGCWETSEGERVGVITKFSHKGAIWSTWEGEMMLGSSNSGSTWQFALDNSSYRNENVQELVRKIQHYAETGERVKLTYKEEMITAPWRSGDTHLIQDVVSVK
jgi:hypothetical protein